MAVDTTLNTVPLGQAGTGAAYILPQGSTAADRLLDTMDYNQKVGQQNTLNKQKAAHQLAQSYQENAFKAKNGTLFNNELMALQQKHIQQGQDYAKQGFDVYNPNPNNPAQMAAHDQYMGDRAKLYNMQDVRDQLQKHLLDQDALLSKAKPGTYDPNSVADLHGFFNNNSLHDIIANGKQAPYVQEAFDPESTVGSKLTPIMSPETEFVKNGHKITSKQFMPRETAAAIGNQFTSTPGGENWVQQQTGITPTQAKLIPDSLDAITKLNDGAFRTPQGQQALVQQGITSYDDPKYQQLLQQKSQQDFLNKQKYNGLIQQYVDRSRAKANIVYKDIPDFTYEDQSMKRQANARAQKDWQDKQDKEDGGDVVFGNEQSQVPVLTQNLNAEGKPALHNSGKIGKDGKPIMVPGSYVEPEQGATLFSQAFPQQKFTVTPGHVVTITNGHSIANTKPFEVTAGQVKMEPVFSGLDATDSRNGAVMSKRQLMEIVSGKSKLGNLSNLKFQPMVYGDRPVKDAKGKVTYEPVAFPYDAVRGNSKLKTSKFDETEKNFHELINSSSFKAKTAQERIDMLSQMFNIK